MREFVQSPVSLPASTVKPLRRPSSLFRIARRTLAVLGCAILVTAIAQWFDDDPPRSTDNAIATSANR